MKPSIGWVGFALLAAASIVGLTSCSKSSRVVRYLANATTYYDTGRYDQAEIEYLNALRLDPNNGSAYAGLGLIYFDQVKVARVYPCLRRARELVPNDLRVRTRLGTLYLNARKYEEARTEALFVLDRDPFNNEAPIIYAQSCVSPAEVASARRRFDAVPANAANGAPIIVARGVLYLAEKNYPAARSTFERAVTQDPKFAAAHVALAALNQAQQQFPAAEQEFATAASLAPVRSGTRIQYAQFELQAGHADAAKRTLDEIIAQAPDSIPPYLILADAALREQQLETSQKLVSQALERDPANPEALALNARIKIANGEPDKAVTILERATALYPQSSETFHSLGLAYASAGDPLRGVVALSEALRLTPDFPTAALALADLQVRTGNLTAAAANLRRLVKQHPEIPAARMALANVCARQGEFEEALLQLRTLNQAFPRSAEIWVMIGAIQIQQGKRSEARHAFEQALDLAPTSLSALEQLVNLDLRAGDPASALQRVKAQIARNPKSAALQLVLARLYLAQKNPTSAEAALQTAISLDPAQPAAYMTLAQLYIASKQDDKATDNLIAAARQNPKSAEPLMMLAVIRHRQQNYAEARDYYEKVIAVQPKFSPALNNLAYIYSEFLNNLDRALVLAQQARRLLPNEPHTADTLGWILFKRRQYPWALSLLEESADKLPTAPDVLVHVGLTRYMLGDEDGAKTALERALAVNGSVIGADEARSALETLAFDPASADATRARKLADLARTQSDPMAWTRTAAWYAVHGDPAKAAEAYEAALQASPNNVAAALGLVRLHRQRNDIAAALQIAKSFRKAAPGNMDVTQVLGELAMAEGNFDWAVSLLQEVVASRPNDVHAALLYAQATYHAGRVDAARDILRTALSDADQSDSASSGRELLTLIALAGDPAKASQQTPRIEQALQTDPLSVPALMARGAAEVGRQDRAAAVKTYQRVLQLRPHFAPACRSLVRLFAYDPTHDREVIDLGSDARAVYANDAELAQILGIALTRTGNYTRAVTLLSQATRARPNDPELYYYLGMAEHQLHDRAASVAALKRALDLKLNAELAAKARDLIAQNR